MKSVMKDVLIEYDVANDLHISQAISACKFLIKKSGSYFTMKYEHFLKMTVEALISFSNIHDDYIIEMKI